MGKQWKQWQTYFLGSKITADGDCSHEIKRHLLLGRKTMTNLDCMFKSRDICLSTKVPIVKATVFPVVMYGCESWAIKKTEHQRTDTFELWCWRKLLRVPWTARRSNQSTLKEISPEYSLEYMLKLKWRAYSLENTLMLWKIESRRRMSWSGHGLVKNFQTWDRMREKIKFIRVGDIVTTPGQLKVELTLNWGP